MNIPTYLASLIAVGALGFHIVPQSAADSPELTDVGKRIEARYSDQLAALKEELNRELPQVVGLKREAYQDARVRRKEAEKELEGAKKQMGELKRAHALVGHAKGKWIGGAKKGIAEAKKMLEKASSADEREAAREKLASWQKNLEDGIEALEERQANLDRLEKMKPQFEQALNEARDALAEAKSDELQAIRDMRIGDFLSSDELDAKLVRHAMLHEATPHALALFAQNGRASYELIEDLLKDESLLRQIAVADGPKGNNYGRAMTIYSAIQNATPNASEGVLQRLALAISLEHAEPIAQRSAKSRTDAPTHIDPVESYLHYERAFKNKELDPAFKFMTVWDLRMVVDGNEPDEILAWGREMLKNYRPDHVKMSNYNWRYVAIVRSDVKYGSQDNKYDKEELQFFQNILMNGGVCGRRAFFGRFILRAFGIPTTARPSRGHAALAHWTPKGWVVCLGGGWGAGWTKTPYKDDLDFLATTQARATGDKFLMVKRAQWAGDVAGEKRAYGFGSKNIGFWNGVSLNTQRAIIEASDFETLAAVGEDIGEANETREKVEIIDVEISEEDQRIRVGRNGVITIPAAATSKPTRSTGKIIFMPSVLGGKQLHYSRTGGHQSFEYEVDVPRSGTYALSGRVVTPSWRQSLQLVVNGAGQAAEVSLPFTVGMWDEIDPVEIELEEGENTLTFSREGDVKGVTIRDFTLTPVETRLSRAR